MASTSSGVALRPPLFILQLLWLSLLSNSIVTVSSSVSPRGSTRTNDHQKESLIALRNSLELYNPNISSVLHDWATNTSSPEYTASDGCDWFGVHCDSASNVITIDLTNLGLQGPLPHHVFSSFPFLTQLYLSFNNFSQSIPLDLGNCTNLEDLDLSHNSLSSTIPTNLTRAFQNIVQIDLSANSLTGQINFGTFFPNMTSLLFLNLSNNQFIGQIPFGYSSTLTVLDLSNNFFNGSLATQPMGTMMMNLQVLRLGHNQLDGEIPQSLFTKCGTAFQELDLSWNSLRGAIPSTLGNCKSLQVLSLSRNYLQDIVPHEIGLLTELRSLILGDNHLTDLSYDLRKLASLVYLDVKRNRLSGSIPAFLGNMGKGAMLEYVWLNGNNLSGAVDGWMLQSLRKLRYIDISNNLLEGELNSILGVLGSVEYLIMAGNRFSGGISDEVGGLTELKVLDVSNNGLNGTISTQLGSLKSLFWLDGKHNHLSGPVPHMIGTKSGSPGTARTFLPDYAGDCSPLRRWFIIRGLPADDMDYEACARMWNRIFVDANDEDGDTSSCTSSGGSLPRTYSLVSLSHNMLSGSIPDQLPSSTSFLLLDNNHISGSVPDSLYRLPLLHLDLSHNKLTGNLSAAGLGNLSCLTVLDLSDNNFSGPIPLEMQGLVHLSSLNLSFNPLLTGSIPTGGPFAMLPSSSYLGDFNLCFNHSSGQKYAHITDLTPPYCSDSNDAASSSMPLYSHLRSKHRTAMIVGIVFGSAILVGIALLTGRRACAGAASSRIAGLANASRNGSESLSLIKTQRSMDREKWVVDMFDKRGRGWALSYSDLVLATCNFSGKYIVGRGNASAVYRLSLGGGVVIGVKRIMLSGPGDALLVQVRRVAALRHPHLVPVFGCLYRGSDHLFLLRFMHNGTLRELLDQDGGASATALDWPRCLKIASGVAKALAFLHGKGIVHGNVKPSNVLLDHHYNAYLADAGFQHADPSMVGPEGGWARMALPGVYAPSGKANGDEADGTAEGDVYSFGVVMLEMVGTRGRACSDAADERRGSQNMVECARDAWRGRRVEEMVGARLSSTCGDRGQFIGWVEAALACTADVAVHRPAMAVVARLLHQLTHSVEQLPPRIYASTA